MDVGQAYVVISGRVDREQIKRSAAEAGNEAGRAIDDGIQDGLGKATRGAATKGAAAGTTFGKAFEVAAERNTKDIDVKLDKNRLSRSAFSAGSSMGSALAEGLSSAGSSGLKAIAGASGPLTGALTAVGVPALAGVGVILGQALAGGILAAPGLLAVGGTIAGTLALSLNGVGDAIGAIFEEPAKKASQAVSNTNAVAAAERSLGQTRKDVAYATKQALERVTDAEKDLTDAQKESLKAQQAVNQARADAAQRLDDLNNSLKDNALDQRSAVLDLADAQKAYDEATKAGSTATAEQQERAAIALEQAQRRLEDLKNTQFDLNGEIAKGVEGSDLVKKAKEDETKATEKVQNAEKKLADAREAATKAQEDGQARIAAAIENLGAVNDRIMAQAADATDKYGDALKKLSPNAALFVEGIKKIAGPLKDVQQSVQDAFFKPLTDVGARLQKSGLLDTLTKGLSGVAGTLGKMVSGLVDQLNKPAFQTVLTNLFAGVSKFLEASGPGLEAFFQGTTAAIAALTPYLPQLGKMFGDVFGLFAQFMNDMIKSGVFDQLVKAFMQFVSLFTAEFVNLLETVFTALADPAVTQAMVDLISELGEITPLLTDLIPWLAEFAVGFIQMGIAVGQTGKDIYDVFKNVIEWAWKNVLEPVFHAISVGWEKVGSGFKWVNDNIIQPVWNAVKNGLAALWSDTQRFFGYIKAGYDAVGAGLKWVNDNLIQPVWQAFKSGLSLLWDDTTKFFGFIKSGFEAVGSGLKWVNDKVIQPVWDAVKSGVGVMSDAVQKAWDAISDAAKKPIKFVVETVLNDGLIAGINTVAKWVGLDGIDKIKLPKGFATGGKIPGTSGFQYRDDRLAMSPSGPIALAGGEYIVNAPAASKNMALLEAINSGRGLASGGSVDDLIAIMNKSGIAGTSVNSTYRNTNDFHGQGLAVDFGGAGNGAIRDRVADYWSRYSGSLLELIHRSDDGSRNWAVKRGKNVGPGYYGEATMNEHRNHVHVAATEAAARAILSGATPAEASDASDGSGITGMIDRVLGGLGKIPGADSPIGQMLTGGAKKLVGGAKSKLMSAFKSLGSFFGFGGGDNDSAASNSGQLVSWARDAMRLTGVGNNWLSGLLTIIQRESGGNPKAINNWDSNAKIGQNSRGLMQVIPSTFQAYHQAGTSNDIFDPVANIAAAINYIRSRYGDISNVQQANPNMPPKGYAMGGRVYDTGGLIGHGQSGTNLSGRPEYVLNPEDTKAFFEAINRPQSQGSTVVIENVNVNERSDVEMLTNQLAFLTRGV